MAFLIDTGGIILAANENTAKMYGTTMDGLIGTCVYDFLPDQAANKSMANAQKVAKSGGVVRFQGTLRGRIFDTSIYPVFDDRGNIKRLAVYCRDVTEKKRVLDALEQSEKNFEALLNATTDMAFLMDTEGIILAANANTAKTYGVPMDSLIGACVYDFLPDQAANKSMANAQKVAKSGGVVRFQGTLKGQIFDNSIYPVFDDQGNIKRLSVYSRDVTEAKRVQDALKQTEEKYRNIYENATEGIFQISPEGRFVSANPSLALIHGYASPEELINSVSNVAELYVYPETLASFTRMLHDRNYMSNFETQMRKKDGSVKWISINARVVRDAGGKILFHEGTMQDITERKQAEDALHESEERYRTAIEHSNDGVSIIKGDIHLYVNRKFVEMFGYDRPEDIIGKPVTITVHPDDIPMVTELNARRQRGLPGTPRYEFKGITRDGKVIYIEVSATSITYRGALVSLVYLRDVTERKHAEEALKESHLELERLNRAKTKAVNHISHELKTPLAVIQGNIRILKRKLEATPLGEGVRANIEVLERNLERLFGISKQTDEIFRVSQELEAGVLLGDLDRLWQRVEDFSEIPPDIKSHWSHLKRWLSRYMSGSPLSFRSIDVYPFLQTLVEKIKQKASHRMLRYVVEGENDLYIFMDSDILNDVLVGILKNAIENTPDGGLIKVSTEQKGDNIDIHVTDYGVGIAEDDLRYLFDGLYDTRETDLYTSKKPYDFGAGGKGFDLLRIKMYGKRFGFDVSVESHKCGYTLNDRGTCPGNTSECTFLRNADECTHNGGTTFTVSFPLGGSEDNEDSGDHKTKALG
jgi:PAS domain S-box-containing protein